mmetsp:Transcript_13509/g.38391  ORF Transcript_13509/g.38391 Transcript_13509/m.38391 type:complete len:188 (-) Transcript_13509:482-1045(-)
MFKSSYQTGYLSIYYSLGSNALQLWGTRKADDDRIVEVVDSEIKSKCLELRSPHIPDCYVSCPGLPDRTLGVRLPVLQLVLKNLGEHFSLEVEVMDDHEAVRRLRASTFQLRTTSHHAVSAMPLLLDDGWNFVQLNLADLTKAVYGTTFVETRRVTLHANCRLRHVFFSETKENPSDLPADFQLYVP